jgi:hypothetical protein
VPASRLCNGCDGVFPSGQLKRGRCPSCLAVQTKGYDQAKRTCRPYNEAERQRRRKVVAAHIAELGLCCLGWDSRPAHAVSSPSHLTAAHIIPVAGRPELETGPLTVRCIWCNAAQGTQVG